MEEELSICPYDNSHRILPRRFADHLIKCRKMYEGTKNLMVCTWNSCHHVPKQKFEKHIEECEDKCRERSDINLQNYQLPTCSQSTPETFANEEVWETENTIIGSVEKIAIESYYKPIARKPDSAMGLSKKQRAEWNDAEILRINNLEKGESILDIEYPKANGTKETIREIIRELENLRLPNHNGRMEASIENREMEQSLSDTKHKESSIPTNRNASNVPINKAKISSEIYDSHIKDTSVDSDAEEFINDVGKEKFKSDFVKNKKGKIRFSTKSAPTVNINDASNFEPFAGAYVKEASDCHSSARNLNREENRKKELNLKSAEKKRKPKNRKDELPKESTLFFPNMSKLEHSHELSTNWTKSNIYSEVGKIGKSNKSSKSDNENSETDKKYEWKTVNRGKKKDAKHNSKRSHLMGSEKDTNPTSDVLNQKWSL